MKADGPPAQGEDSIMIEKPNENPKAVDWFSEGPIRIFIWHKNIKFILNYRKIKRSYT